MATQSGRIQRLGYDDAFLRNWRYYLGICTASFATGQTDVVQFELAHAAA
jgi:cyclopropane-fatty-acyl-phospholipid synthase